jgi:cyclohexanone monooxygenase
VTPEYRQWINDNWDKIFDQVKHSITGFGFNESERSYHDASPEEREQVFEENWQKGNGFRCKHAHDYNQIRGADHLGFSLSVMFGTFNDIATDMEANEGACDFVSQRVCRRRDFQAVC